MSREQTAEEVREEYVRAMGHDLGNTFFEFRNECITLHWKWEEYVALFGTNPGRIELLNRAAGAFFRIVQDTLWEDVVLRIARLTDAPKSMGKDNLTLQRLPALVETALQGKVETLLQECLNKGSFARDWRNRRLAHSDLALVLGDKTAAPLAPASRKDVTEVLAAIVALLNSVQTHYLRSEAMYELRPIGNAETLLYVLRDGLQAEEDRQKRFESGTCTKEDIDGQPAL
jgi:hypothetical protein